MPRPAMNLCECRDPVDSPISRLETRLGIRLFRLATGANYSDVSRRFSVSEPVAKFCVSNNLASRNYSAQISINGVAVPQFLVSNGDYPLLNWLMLPFDDPVSQPNEENFNNAINLMRLPAVKAVDSLRNWGVLSEPIEGEIKTAVASIGACSILHNMLLSREDYSAFCEDLSNYSFHKYQSSLNPSDSDSVACAIRNSQ
ncbi:hypothetical protein HAX54_002012 [Datura stramonium]|uniref:DDE Tnp4 domain-containing protein n=1 Tax=Datura stramonium TaxID=4076 RepID=A0ABS8T385_DATST|nr:hypothetical protein [Datura stramonium]